ncbi:MAG: hypothetical protein ACOWWR_15160 [Eubacteriales bacterium]
MTEDDCEKKTLKNEELRGLFVFGLLAVLVSYRLKDENILFTLGQSEFSLIPILDVTIIMWSMYAFFMVVALSGQELGENVAKVFRNYSSLILKVSFITLAMLFSAVFIVGFPNTWHFVFLLLMVMAGARLVSIVQMDINLSGTGFNAFVTRIKENKWATFDFGFSMIMIFTLLGLITYFQDPIPSILYIIGISDILVHTIVNIKFGRWTEDTKNECD